MYIHGEHVFSRILVKRFNTDKWPPPPFFPCLDKFQVTFADLNIKSLGHIHIPKNVRWVEYLQENLKLSWIVIDPTQKHAANLFRYTCKPRSVKIQPLYKDEYHKVVCGTVMAGEGQVRSEMVNCLVKLTCFSNGGDGLYVRKVVIVMEDTTINRNLVALKQGATILLNAIQNGERKKFDLPKQEVDKFQISNLQRKKNRNRKRK